MSSDSPFEPQEGEPFTEVARHVDGSSPDGNPLGAVAYTHGTDVPVGGPGKKGQKNIAHETTHVIQQEVPVPFGGDTR